MEDKQVDLRRESAEGKEQSCEDGEMHCLTRENNS